MTKRTYMAERPLRAEEMEGLAFQYAAAKNMTDAEGALSVCSEDFAFEVATGTTVRIAGRDQVRQHLTELWAAIPDLRTSVDWTVTGGDRLVAVGRLTGTVSGPYFGVEATGRKFDVPLVSILTFQGKRIVAESNHVDMLALFTQIGILGDEALEATTGRSA